MTPEQAGWRLAAAHRKMGSKDAKEHAQAMASALASSDLLLGQYHDQIVKLVGTVNAVQGHVASTVMLMSALADALTVDDRNKAIGIAAGLIEAAGPFLSIDDLPLLPPRVGLFEAWPEIFDPKRQN